MAFPSDRVVKGFGLLNGRLTLFLPYLNTELAIFGVNLLDRENPILGINPGKGGAFGFYTQNYGIQRRVGVEVTYRFGGERG